jgi:hypothetical protein
VHAEVTVGEYKNHTLSSSANCAPIVLNKGSSSPCGGGGIKNANRTISKQAKRDCINVVNLEVVEVVNESVRDKRKLF